MVVGGVALPNLCRPNRWNVSGVKSRSTLITIIQLHKAPEDSEEEISVELSFN